MIYNHPLFPVFLNALYQVGSPEGKGEVRHGKGIPFMSQKWVHISNTHGLGFLTGQAAKKLEEAQGFLGDETLKTLAKKVDLNEQETLDKLKAYEREMLGVLVYTGMSLMRIYALFSRFNPLNPLFLGDEDSKGSVDKLKVVDGFGKSNPAVGFVNGLPQVYDREGTRVIIPFNQLEAILKAYLKSNDYIDEVIGVNPTSEKINSELMKQLFPANKALAVGV